MSLIQIATAMEFIKGGKSEFTIRNPKNNKSYLYKVKRADFADIYYVSVMNKFTNKFQYMGIITSKNEFKRTDKSKVSNDFVGYKVFFWVFTRLKNNQDISYLEIHHTGKCCRCNRRLTDPLSVAYGYGNDCFTKLKGESLKDHDLKIKFAQRCDEFFGLAV